ncbi:branched-chain amino acid ABC transporter permease [Alloalcanivorax mobilis]|uniref:branched-chain amino acid ABC transporter permease n=1 Tax=Alloalcanivorax mobilis TaxID=2019569 RepID=UPI000B5B23E6|nr:branched-chain amino acid ABC transporter permease [Alloalcanivorax mobilis]ASK35615.1 branched-chain amino acid ABC transporter permease [Alcanivorax sp. N3-2A]|tara:strand:+ start:20233 stop:21174 length:942 start_codon:yes stop_codon:yes gene_type:complete
MDYFLVSLLNGVIYGLMLFMVSSGLTLIFGMMGVLNFAHASFYMIGAYIGYLCSLHLGFYAGLVIAPLVVGALGVFSERLLLRRVRPQGHTHELLLTFGLFFIFEEVIKVFFGNFAVPYQVPAGLDFAAFSVGSIEYPFYRLFIGVVALVMFVAILAVLQLTRLGIVVRAAVHRSDMVAALGHNVPTVFTALFGGGAALAGLAGAVAGAFFPTSPTMASDLGTLVFVVVVIGGLGSLSGAVVGALLIGVVTSFAVGLNVSLASLAASLGLGDTLTQMGGLFTVSLSSLAGTIPYLLMLLILLLRPSGLLGERS